jgi:hypothetical protein
MFSLSTLFLNHSKHLSFVQVLILLKETILISPF